MATDKNPMDITACQTLQLMANAVPNKERLCGGRPVKQVCAQADCRTSLQLWHGRSDRRGFFKGSIAKSGSCPSIVTVPAAKHSQRYAFQQHLCHDEVDTT